MLSNSRPVRMVLRGALLLLPAASWILLSGCDGSPGNATAEMKPPARFQAVTVKPGVGEKEIDGFCDARGLGKIEMPELQENAPKLSGPAWVNVWATWCKSCVEEMPMIASWKEKLGAQIVFISADEDPEALPHFIDSHKNFPKTLRMKDPEALPEWLKSNGIEAGSGLPLHLFVDAGGEVLCARTGAIAEHHYPVVESLLK